MGLQRPKAHGNAQKAAAMANLRRKLFPRKKRGRKRLRRTFSAGKDTA
ncbi:hypothetical protein L195_g063143, partial [Trifolium pratense]